MVSGWHCGSLLWDLKLAQIWADRLLCTVSSEGAAAGQANADSTLEGLPILLTPKLQAADSRSRNPTITELKPFYWVCVRCRLQYNDGGRSSANPKPHYASDGKKCDRGISTYDIHMTTLQKFECSMN
jgi:hypothetical protein